MTDEFLDATAQLQRAYQNVFGEHTAGAEAVLEDLAIVCRAYAPAHSKREQGMRDVWLHIQRRLQLQTDELAAVISTRLSPAQRVALFSPELRQLPKRG